jgi:Flp pilus assembly protein TadG
MARLREYATNRSMQRGAYAVEFALVFLLSFALLYGTLCVGILAAFRLGLQNAAEDGARAALRYQPTFAARATQASNVATNRISWLPSAATRDVAAQVCQVVGNNCAAPVCGPTWDARCQMVVTVRLTNVRTMLPPLPAFIAPTQLVGQASMVLDGRAM